MDLNSGSAGACPGETEMFRFDCQRRKYVEGNNCMKRILLTSAIVLGLGGIGVGGYAATAAAQPSNGGGNNMSNGSNGENNGSNASNAGSENGHPGRHAEQWGDVEETFGSGPGPGPGFGPGPGPGPGPGFGPHHMGPGPEWRMREHHKLFSLFPPERNKQLSASDVKTIATAILLEHGVHDWNVTDVKSKNNEIDFSFATQHGDVIANFAMDPRTGFIKRLD